MRKLILFAILSSGLAAFGQTLSPAADGHILRNQTFVFLQSDPSVTYGGQTTYFNYFQNLYVAAAPSRPTSTRRTARHALQPRAAHHH